MLHHRRPVYLLLALLFAVLAADANAGSKISDQALTLMPADAMALIVFSSLDEIDQQLVEHVRAAADPAEAEEMSAAELLPGQAKSLRDTIDPARPLALVFGLGMQYGPPEPVMTMILPVLDGADPQTMAMVSGMSSAEQLGDYVALSVDPNYRAGGAVPALAENLPDGQIVGRADLETVFAIMRPMIDMMFSAMETQAEQDPTAETLPEPTIQALRGIIESARVAEFAVDESDGELDFLLGMEVFAGSVLDVGPQPPLEDALKLAGHLPDWGEIVAVYAMDLSLLYQNMPFLREPSMMQLSKAMAEPKTEAAITWWTVADELSRPLERASAATARFSEQGIEFAQVAAMDGARMHAEKIHAHLGSLPDAQMGFVLVEEASDTRDDMLYHRYRWDFDAAQMMEFMADDPTEELPDQEDMENFSVFMRTMLPPLHMVALDDRIGLMMMPEGEELDEVLARFAAGPQMPPMALEGLSQWAGEDVEMLAQMELRSMLQELGEMMAVLAPEEPFEVPDGEPVRIRYAAEAGEIRHAARLQTRTGALIRFIQEMEELQEMSKGELEEAKDYSGSDEG